MRRLAEGLCDDKQRSKCQAEHPDFLEWACSQCEKLRVEDLHPYTLFLLKMEGRIRAGYPMGQDDLDLDTWDDLAAVVRALQELRERRSWQKYL